MRAFLKSFGGISAAAVEEFERRNQLTLPADYREFLIHNNGGQLHAMACFITDVDDGVLVEILLGVGQAERTFSSEYWLNRLCHEMPAGFVVVGLGATGLFILGTEEPAAGVYFWDDAHAFKGSSEPGGNTYQVAKTFTEFMCSLRPVE